MDCVKIVSLNTNSIINLNRRILCDEFIKRERAHIYALQEIKASERHKIHFDGFNVLRQHGKNNNHGTAILVKNTFEIKNFRTYSGHIEGCSIDVKIENMWIRIHYTYINNTGRCTIDNFNNFFVLICRLI